MALLGILIILCTTLRLNLAYESAKSPKNQLEQAGLPQVTASASLDSQSEPPWMSVTSFNKTHTPQDPRQPIKLAPVPCSKPPCGHAMALAPPIETSLPVKKPRNDSSIPVELQSECSLWDPSCQGNRTKAAIDFLGYDGTKDKILGASREDCAEDSMCLPFDAPHYVAIKKWMRSAECQKFLDEIGKGDPHVWRGDTNCCGACNLQAGNVDIFYWPEPDADTSCLSIIGDEVHALDQGATTDDRGSLYWGCTVTPTNGATGAHAWIRTTAILSTLNHLAGITSKVYLVDPYGPQLCPQTASNLSSSTMTLKQPLIRPSLQATVRSLVIPSSGQWRNVSSISTLMSGNFTFTSPSIYAHFTSLMGLDQCGSSVIQSTMLTFSPGELSSIGPPGLDSFSSEIKPFDFKDLPCPPFDIASRLRWRPERGEPYRPLIAIHSRIQNLNPFFSSCTMGTFSGHDPPHALQAAPTMVPQGQGLPDAQQTPQAEGVVAMPANLPVPDLPEQTPVPAPKQKAGDMVAKEEDPQRSSNLEEGNNAQSNGDIRGQELHESPNNEKPVVLAESHSDKGDISLMAGDHTQAVPSSEVESHMASSIDKSGSHQEKHRKVGDAKEDSIIPTPIHRGDDRSYEGTATRLDGAPSMNEEDSSDRGTLEVHHDSAADDRGRDHLDQAQQSPQHQRKPTTSEANFKKEGSQGTNAEEMTQSYTSSEKFDPNNISPVQMTRLHDALSPDKAPYSVSKQPSRPHEDQIATPNSSQKASDLQQASGSVSSTHATDSPYAVPRPTTSKMGQFSQSDPSRTVRKTQPMIDTPPGKGEHKSQEVAQASSQNQKQADSQHKDPSLNSPPVSSVNYNKKDNTNSRPFVLAYDGSSETARPVPSDAGVFPVDWTTRTINGQPFQQIPGGVSIAGTTLSAGTLIMTMSDGKPLSVGSSIIVVGFTTVTLDMSSHPGLPSNDASHEVVQANATVRPSPSNFANSLSKSSVMISSINTPMTSAQTYTAKASFLRPELYVTWTILSLIETAFTSSMWA